MLILRAGKQPILHSEDVLRYKAKDFTVNKEAVIDLFQQVMNYPGVNEMGISHFALSSVYNAPDVIEELSNIVGCDKNGWFGGQTGIETGSPRLIKDNMAGKVKPYKPEDWPTVVVDAFQILNDNNWVPASTLIVGLPGEEEHDVQLTLDLVEELKDFKSIIVPLFFVSQGGFKDKESFTLDDVTPRQCELILKCWDHNLDWSKYLLKEYFEMTGNGIRERVAEKIFSYVVRRARNVLKVCIDDYNYDLKAIMADADHGELNIIPKQLLSMVNLFS